MKLYTEEEVKNAIILGKMHLQKKTLFEILDMLTPIELPSDEEIKDVASTNTISVQEEVGFEQGAFWMKEQILNQNKVDMCYAFISQIDGKNKKCLKCGKDMFEHYNQNHLGGITY